MFPASTSKNCGKTYMYFLFASFLCNAKHKSFTVLKIFHPGILANVESRDETLLPNLSICFTKERIVEVAKFDSKSRIAYSVVYGVCSANSSLQEGAQALDQYH